MTTISAETMTKMKETYKQWLFTREGQSFCRQATQARKEWAEYNGDANFTFNTASVQPSLICQPIREKMKKIKITPVGFNNLCHKNAELFAKAGAGKAVRGFNVTACPCGKFYNAEFHSVNQDAVTGEFYDFTMDFNKETEKWFIPLDTTNSALGLIDTMEANLIRTINTGCKCNIRWKMPEGAAIKRTEKRLVEEMEMMERITIMCF